MKDRWAKDYPDSLESVKRAIENAEFLCGLDKKTMKQLIEGEYTYLETSNSMGRQSKKIVIEYDVTYPKNE